MSIKGLQRRAGFTLVEFLVSIALGSIVAAMLALLTFYTGRSVAGMVNYVDLDNFSRKALDTMSREIRQTQKLVNYTATSLAFLDYDGKELKYVYDSSSKKLLRQKTNEPDVTLLKECNTLEFSIYQRNPVGGTYNQYPTATAGTCKLVQLKWICSRTVLGTSQNTESVQSAKIVIRKQ